jgi:peptidoglycan hydrolase-like protein with peptidoglycan-binding domain
MRAMLIVVAVAVVVGAAVFVVSSVQWRGDEAQLGPSEAQQNREQARAVQQHTPSPPLSQEEIRRYQEQLDAAGFDTGAEKGTITPQTEAALRAYQEAHGLPTTGNLDEATRRSLTAGQRPTPGKAVEGESIPGGTAPAGRPR